MNLTQTTLVHSGFGFRKVMYDRDRLASARLYFTRTIPGVSVQQTENFEEVFHLFPIK